MRQGECAASWAPARGVRRRGEVGKVRLREANVLETSMLCLFYYLRGPVVPVFRIYKDRISIIKWKRWSQFTHSETTARSRDATLAVCISGGPAAGGSPVAHRTHCSREIRY